MKNAKLLLIVALAMFVAALSLTTSGCKSDDNPVDTDQPITDDLFPLKIGRQLVFSGFLRDAKTNINIEATGAVYEARMTVTATSQATPFGTAHVLLDSQRVPTGLPNPPTTWFIQPYYIQRSQPEGSGDFEFLTNIGRIYRLFNIQRTDSLQWILLVKQSAGVKNTWKDTVGSWTGQVQPGVTGQILLVIEGTIEDRADITLGGQQFRPYKVTAKRKLYLNGVPAIDATTAELWLEPGVGIVKFIYHADGETSGFSRDYKSRNF